MTMLLFGEVELGPERFAAMAPHLRGEAVRLLSDAGYGWKRICEALGIDADTFSALYKSRHAFRVGKPDRALPADEDGERTLVEQDTLQAAILALIAGEGGRIALSFAALAGRMDAPKERVIYAVHRLAAKGLIQKTGGGGRRAVVWSLTRKGQRLAAEGKPEPEAADA